jgi:hypothetical protein
VPDGLRRPRCSKRFQLILIRPSHYDGAAYVIRWQRAIIPSNSLAALYGIGLDCAERVLGPDVVFDIEAIDEANTRMDISAIIAHACGLENINPDNLVAANKRQNKITEYREMLLAWRAQEYYHMRRHGLPPAPERKRTTTWAEFIRAHLAVLAGTDFSRRGSSHCEGW